jgi:bifunctional UDP-N-acetylglucosamine pyrophosphorylase/glucosamine-1-phosphate N-acetyltransferase
MIYEHLQALVLAAGSSSRFKTGKNKLLSTICGQELIVYPITLLGNMHIPTTIVVGSDKESISQLLAHHVGDTLTYVTQEEQQGTAHAIYATRDTWYQDHVLIMHGDTPLVTPAIIHELYAQHIQTEAAISFVMAHNADPSLRGYGRVITHQETVTIAEDTQLTTHSNDHCCINAGIYLVQRSFLESFTTTNDTSFNECSFATVINHASKSGYKVTPVTASFDRVRGVNTLQDLWAAEQIKRSEIIKQWMDCGVHFPLAQTVHIDVPVTIGAGTSIGSGVHIKGNTTIGNNCTIKEFSIIENSIIGDNVHILSHSVITNSHLDAHVHVGPFAHIREQSHLQEQSIIGNFVEVKKTTIGKETKAKHLSYLGNADIGAHVNIGAGTITCNHNGVSKQKTTIEDNAYIGVNNTLIAPVTIGAYAYTAGGSVITDDVPSQALAIGRARQIIKEGYAKKLRAAAQGVAAEPEQPQSFVAAIKTNNTTPSSENT